MPNFNSFLHQEEHVFPQKLVITKRKSSHGLLPREERPLENASRFDSVNRQSTLQISSFSMKTEGKNSVELTQLFTCQLTCYTHETFIPNRHLYRKLYHVTNATPSLGRNLRHQKENVPKELSSDCLGRGGTECPFPCHQTQIPTMSQCS